MASDTTDLSDATRAIFTFEISLEHQPPIAQDNESVEIPYTFVRDGLVEPSIQIGRKAGLRGRYRRPWVRLRRQRLGK
jgi:hypothetical protein